MKHKKAIKILLAALFITICGVVYSLVSKSGTTEAKEVLTEVPAETEEASAESEQVLVCVHVCGAVNNPGVYFLPEGSRIFEAAEMAGGLKETAAGEYINLAETISDGQQIYIPDESDVLDGGFAHPFKDADDGLVNINTASAEELKTIPGIGDTKADSIISYRNNIARFEKIEDIMNVAGIKENLFEQIKDYIKV